MKPSKDNYEYKKTYRFDEDTLYKLNEITKRYNATYSSEVIRTLIENEYNRLRNPQAEAIKDPESDLKSELLELKRIVRLIDKCTYETRDMVNTIMYEAEYDDFASADNDKKYSDLVQGKHYCNALQSSRQNYEQKAHSNSMNKAADRSLRKADK